MNNFANISFIAYDKDQKPSYVGMGYYSYGFLTSNTTDYFLRKGPGGTPIKVVFENDEEMKIKSMDYFYRTALGEHYAKIAFELEDGEIK